MIRKSLGVALDTMPEQRQAIADGEASEETYRLLTERVAVLAAQAKSACDQLAAIAEQDWSALHGHVAACPTCKPRNPRKLRERVEYMAPGLVALPEDDDRRWLAWLNAPQGGPVQVALRKITETLNRINPALADPQVAKAVLGVAGLLLAGVFTLVGSEAVPASPGHAAPPGQSAPTTGTTGDPTDTTAPTGTETSDGQAPPTSGSNAPVSQANPGNPNAPQGEQGARTAKYDIKPPAPRATTCEDDTGRMSASPPDPAPGSINIDARPLMFRHFHLNNQSGWLDSRTVQTLQLGPGSYPFLVAAPVAFAFTVTQAGTVDYPAELEGFLSGKGTRTLRVEGVIITIDARALNTGAGVMMAYASNTNDWIVCRRVRILPAKHYAVQQGSGHVVSFQFEVTRDARVLFDPNLGFVRGSGTSTVEFLGYLLHVDARAAGGTGLLVHYVWGLPFTYTKEQTVRLLPTSSHYLQIVGGKVSDAKFTLHNNGSIMLNHDALALDSEGGVPVVTVTRPLQ